MEHLADAYERLETLSTVLDGYTSTVQYPQSTLANSLKGIAQVKLGNVGTRVFYTSMGHREDVWTNPMYQGLLLGALGWATGRVDADLTPNIKEVTPQYNQLHK